MMPSSVRIIRDDDDNTDMNIDDDSFGAKNLFLFPTTEAIEENPSTTPSTAFDYYWTAYRCHDHDLYHAFREKEKEEEDDDDDQDTPRKFQQQEDENFHHHQRSNVAKLDSIKLNIFTPTCLALFGIVILILGLFLLLSNYYTTSRDDFQIPSTSLQQASHDGFAMTVTEQQMLLKSYLGSLDDGGGSSFSNMKLPAGGNPIDLIWLLKSRIVDEQEQEHNNT